MRSSFLIAYLTVVTHCFGNETIDAPNLAANVINQIPIHENGCGPIALFNAYALSSTAWRTSTDKIEGSPEAKFNYFTKTFCSRFSRNSYMRKRWDPENGIRQDDLTEAINELHKKANLPEVSLKSLFLTKNLNHHDLLKKLHAHTLQSLENGFPPILSVSRFTRIQSRNGGHRWAEVGSHFITITSIPKEIPTDAQNFEFSYAEPWGGCIKSSAFIINESSFFANDITNRSNKKLRKNPTLVLPADTLTVGNSLVQKNTPQALAVTHIIIANSSPTTRTPQHQ